jgi:hypothetical protein
MIGSNIQLGYQEKVTDTRRIKSDQVGSDLFSGKRIGFKATVRLAWLEHKEMTTGQVLRIVHPDQQGYAPRRGRKA